jgi:hypothetical protein
MVKRAGVDMDPAHTFPPGPAHRFGEQPAAVAKARQVRDEADKCKLALARLAEVELEHADGAAVPVADGIEIDVRIADHGEQFVVIENQAREPQPRRADQLEQLAILAGGGVRHALQAERRRWHLDCRR